MWKQTFFRLLLIAVMLSLPVMLLNASALFADSTDSAISGRLAATFDSSTGTVTAMMAGYQKGNPVTIGPVSWQSTMKDFSVMKAEDIGKNLCRNEFDIKRVIRTSNNGKELVAEVVLVKQESPVVVGR